MKLHQGSFVFFFFFLFVCSGCSTGPQPIEFGKDACDFCKMIIADAHFGAELITEKGKVYKFDSGECLVRYLRQKTVDQSRQQGILVVDHAQPGKLIDVKKALFLQSEHLPSPMGANLSAYGSVETMNQSRNGADGETWTWEQVMEKIK